ncbi:uncharacterized protein TNIN_51851 [Trichonephila inaurata madagascariensis]|uniref:Uncharacterized protein n=1 Tax=Trichonephila inaurata madagascariensis TaxID=2747483 RepID=A0A8X6WP18_9ARAC|nr:uncharacterized protein TNIN_51851 [Trichonephila inaurata madagascariensis]
MPRKILTIPEALEVFHNLPSDIESDESSLSEAEDVMTAKSSSSENTDINEEKDDISVPGPSRHQKFPEKRFASNSCSGPMKLKFRKHTVSEKDRLKNVGHIPTKCKSRRWALTVMSDYA